ncbi:MAG: HEAT repeat domain-containing protein [Myxococcales bacterium]|nr:HEAT repeat domain-containing protein [Myxococcales bacterium]
MLAATSTVTAGNAASLLWQDWALQIVLWSGVLLLAMIVSLMALTAYVRIARHKRLDVRKQTQNAVRLAVHQLLAEELTGEQAAERVQPWPIVEVVRALDPYRRALRGPELQILLSFYETLGLVDRAEQMLLKNGWWERLEGVRLLASASQLSGTMKARVLLTGRLADKDALVRLAAARALGALATTEDAPRLLVALEEAPEGHRLTLARALMRSGALPAQSLIALHQEGHHALHDDRLRALSLRALGLARSHEAAPQLIDALDDTAAMVRVAAARALVALRVKVPRRQLLTILLDEEPSVVEAAAQLAGSQGDESLLGPLLQTVRHPNWQARHAAANALANFGAAGFQVLQAVVQQGSVGSGVAERALAERRGANLALMDFEASLAQRPDAALV